MKTNFLMSMALAAAAVGTSLPAYADKPPVPVVAWTVETPNVSVNPTTHIGTLNVDNYTFTFSDPAAPALSVAYYNDNPPNNSASTIATFIANSNVLGLTPSTALTYVGQQDSFGGGVITSSTPFNYLAVHVGGGELLFHWASQIKSFTLNGQGLSNYRAYTSPVPEPSTYGMLLGGLGLLGWMARRRKAG